MNQKAKDNGNAPAMPYAGQVLPDGRFIIPEGGLTKRELGAFIVMGGLLACYGKQWPRDSIAVEARACIDTLLEKLEEEER